MAQAVALTASDRITMTHRVASPDITKPNAVCRLSVQVFIALQHKAYEVEFI
jgi:hypothetical protein